MFLPMPGKDDKVETLAGTTQNVRIELQTTQKKLLLEKKRSSNFKNFI